jgi:DNA-directed RNA polymerase subunit M/transcription elongation factor TFIIS
VSYIVQSALDPQTCRTPHRTAERTKGFDHQRKNKKRRSPLYFCFKPIPVFLLFSLVATHVIITKCPPQQLTRLVRPLRFKRFPDYTQFLGSLLFCPTCGTLLDLPQDGESVVTCEQCGHEEPASCMYTPSCQGYHVEISQLMRTLKSPRAHILTPFLAPCSKNVRRKPRNTSRATKELWCVHRNAAIFNLTILTGLRKMPIVWKP